MGSKRQEYRETVQWLKARDWLVDEDRSGYPMAYCPCGEHMKTIHLTPSDPGYYRNLRSWVERTERNGCTKEGT